MPHRQHRRPNVDAPPRDVGLPHFAAGPRAPFNQSYRSAAGRKQNGGDQAADSGADDDHLLSRHFQHRARKRLSFFNMCL
jgi:hypothetical protein